MELKRIRPVSVGKMFGALYAVLGLIGGGITSLATLMLSQAAESMGINPLLGMGAICLFPIFYGILGFITGVIGAFLYNITAQVVGGIELEFE